MYTSLPLMAGGGGQDIFHFKQLITIQLLHVIKAWQGFCSQLQFTDFKYLDWLQQQKCLCCYCNILGALGPFQEQEPVFFWCTMFSNLKLQWCMLNYIIQFNFRIILFPSTFLFFKLIDKLSKNEKTPAHCSFYKK